MIIKGYAKPSLGYQALEFLYDKATKDSGDDPSDEVELAYMTLLEIIEAYEEDLNV